MVVECFEGISIIVENCAESNLRIMKNLEFLKSVVWRAQTLNDNFYFDIIVNLFDSILMVGDELQKELLESGIFDFFENLL